MGEFEELMVLTEESMRSGWKRIPMGQLAIALLGSWSPAGAFSVTRCETMPPNLAVGSEMAISMWRQRVE